MKSVSPYRFAIDQTVKTIDTRAKNFRNLIIVVVVLSVGSTVAGLSNWALAPFTGLLLVVPVCGFFFFFDQKLLTDWRSQLVDEWVKRHVNFSNFCEAVSSIPTLPKNTLQGMLATLPSVQDLIAEQGMSSSTREAVAAAVSGIQACQSDKLALKTTAATIASGAVVIAAGSHTWEPLLGGSVLVFLPICRKWMKRRRIELIKQKSFAARAKTDFSSEKYGQLVACLHWCPISKLEKEGLLTEMESGAQ